MVNMKRLPGFQLLKSTVTTKRKQDDIVFLSLAIHPCPIIPVCVRLVGSLTLDTNVVCLLLCQYCELCTQGIQVQPSNLLIQLLWQEVYIILVLLCLLPILQEIDLGKCLIGKGARHDK